MSYPPVVDSFSQDLTTWTCTTQHLAPAWHLAQSRPGLISQAIQGEQTPQKRANSPSVSGSPHPQCQGALILTSEGRDRWVTKSSMPPPTAAAGCAHVGVRSASSQEPHRNPGAACPSSHTGLLGFWAAMAGASLWCVSQRRRTPNVCPVGLVSVSTFPSARVKTKRFQLPFIYLFKRLRGGIIYIPQNSSTLKSSIQRCFVNTQRCAILATIQSHHPRKFPCVL